LPRAKLGALDLLFLVVVVEDIPMS